MTFVGIGDTPITLSGHAVGQIAELLEHCEAFLRHASRTPALSCSASSTSNPPARTLAG